MRWLFFCPLFFLACTPAQLDHLKDTTWNTGRCSLFSVLSCAGQAVGKCSVDSGGGSFASFSDCLVNSTPQCVSRGVSRCAMSGAMKAAGTTLIAAGGVGCVTEESTDLVRECVREIGPETEGQAIHAVADCWASVCD